MSNDVIFYVNVGISEGEKSTKVTHNTVFNNNNHLHQYHFGGVLLIAKRLAQLMSDAESVV